MLLRVSGCCLQGSNHDFELDDATHLVPLHDVDPIDGNAINQSLELEHRLGATNYFANVPERWAAKRPSAAERYTTTTFLPCCGV